MYVIGFDIGGTKCAVILAELEKEKITFLERAQIATGKEWRAVLDELCREGKGFLLKHEIRPGGYCAGVSCGGPLDAANGIVQSPPNLPGWDNVPVCEYIAERLQCGVRLANDADACALAEWKYGAGKGCRNMIFLTFGTGLGAGLILNGKLYSGANGNAGEAGHIRLAKQGPTGYGKRGSFEGFCSGGGLSRLAAAEAKRRIKRGLTVSYLKDKPENITAKDIAAACEAGREDAFEIMALSGKYLGRGLAVLIDILNPERIVVGSIFARAGRFMLAEMEKALRQEALSQSLAACKILPAALGEQIGDYATIAASFDF